MRVTHIFNCKQTCICICQPEERFRSKARICANRSLIKLDRHLPIGDMLARGVIPMSLTSFMHAEWVKEIFLHDGSGIFV